MPALYPYPRERHCPGQVMIPPDRGHGRGQPDWSKAVLNRRTYNDRFKQVIDDSLGLLGGRQQYADDLRTDNSLNPNRGMTISEFIWSKKVDTNKC